MCSFIDSLYCEKLREYIKKPSVIEINEDEFAVRIDNQSSFVIKKTISFDQESYSIFYTERGTERLLDSSLELKRIKKSFAIKLKTAYTDRPIYENRKLFDKIKDHEDFVRLIRNTFDKKLYSIGHKEYDKLSIIHDDMVYKIYILISGNSEKLLDEKTNMYEAYLSLYNYLIYYDHYSKLITEYEKIFNDHYPTAKEILEYIVFPVM